VFNEFGACNFPYHAMSVGVFAWCAHSFSEALRKPLADIKIGTIKSTLYSFIRLHSTHPADTSDSTSKTLSTVIGSGSSVWLLILPLTWELEESYSCGCCLVAAA